MPMLSLTRFRTAFSLALLATAATVFAQAPKITPQKAIIGFSIGDDYHVANYTQISQMMLQWAKESDRLKVVSIGNTAEGRPQYMAIISSPENLAKMDHYKEISRRLARAEATEAEAHALAIEGKAIIWIDGGLHATETVNAQSLAEMIYQMASRTDAETMRFLHDVILLMPVPNPDGVELVANWYMRPADLQARTFATLPRLYHKYVGHDNNRDSIMHNMPETINQNKVMFIDWYPQIMHNVHQTGPVGQVVFIPPFRDPFNYDYDPLIPLGIEEVGIFMHTRLVEQGKGGSAMRSSTPYSTWFNGNMRTAGYFRNQIGILTEIIGGPTPQVIPLVLEKQLPQGDWPLPIAPQTWHYRQSIDYMIELERAVVDYASRNREPLLFNRYTMGARSIAAGNMDSWTITPKRIEAAKEAAKAAEDLGAANGRGRGRGGRGGPGGGGSEEGGPAIVGAGMTIAPPEIYTKVLHAPAFRDPRGYIISADQDDFPTAVKFVNVLQKGGVEVQKATAAFTVAGKNYPAGSYIVKSAQAFRAAVLDSFEPQDHPMDLAYPGGPPKRPYDITGWTISKQMGIQYDRVLEAFDGPFVKIGYTLEKPPAAKVAGAGNAVGYYLSHHINDSFIVINRLLKANCEVYWLKDAKTVGGHDLGTGTIWVPSNPAVLPILQRAAQELGVPAFAASEKPTGAALKLKPIRIGLVDVYGGSMPSGWTRWIFENYEFPFEVVFPQVLDAGNLRANFDVIVFPSGTFAEARGGRALGGGPFGAPPPEMIPEEYRSMLGSISSAKTVPPLKTFVEEGGTVIAVGSAASIGQPMGLPVKDHLVEIGPDGASHHLSADKFYIPGSVLSVDYNNKDPLAYGMPEHGYVFFDDSPVFDRVAGGKVEASKVAWFPSKTPLYSGWAVGQEHLEGGEFVTDASIGRGKLVLLGAEATFRGTPHSTYKLLFNALYIGSATDTTL